MTEIEGIVQALKIRESSYSFLLSDGNWYSDWGKPEIEKGDKVKFEWVTKGNFKNVQGEISKTGESMEKEATQKTAKEYFTPANEYYKDRDESIIRQVAFKGSIEIMTSMMSNKGVAFTKEGVIDAVREYTNEFEKIILGLYEPSKQDSKED